MAVDIDKMTNVLVVYNTEDAEEVEVRRRGNLCQSGRRDSGTCCDRGLAQRKKRGAGKGSHSAAVRSSRKRE
mgnify:CR=1 FL=1